MEALEVIKAQVATADGKKYTLHKHKRGTRFSWCPSCVLALEMRLTSLDPGTGSTVRAAWFPT